MLIQRRASACVSRQAWTGLGLQDTKKTRKESNHKPRPKQHQTTTKKNTKASRTRTRGIMVVGDESHPHTCVRKLCAAKLKNQASERKIAPPLRASAPGAQELHAACRRRLHYKEESSTPMLRLWEILSFLGPACKATDKRGTGRQPSITPFPSLPFPSPLLQAPAPVPPSLHPPEFLSAQSVTPSYTRQLRLCVPRYRLRHTRGTPEFIADSPTITA